MEAFKNHLGYSAAQKIAKAIKRADSKFNDKSFLKGLEKVLEPLELKARMLLITQRLASHVHPSPRSFPLLLKSLKQNESDIVGVSGFHVWPLSEFVAQYGLDDFKTSLETLKKMTPVFSSEFAIRPFILKDEAYVLKQFMKWSRDEDEHVRRWVSEGTRPTLPWGQKLPRFLENPELTWPLLDALKNDSSRYVQKSVANHMNDFSKQHPDWLVRKLKQWPNPWVVRHSLRTLIKQGHRGALTLMGVDKILPKLHLLKLKKTKIYLGETLEIDLKLENTQKRTSKTVVDVEIHFLKANNKHSSKVFKGAVMELAAGEVVGRELRIPLRKVTTRRYYYGKHYVNLLVNGQKTEKLSFTFNERV